MQGRLPKTVEVEETTTSETVKTTIRRLIIPIERVERMISLQLDLPDHAAFEWDIGYDDLNGVRIVVKTVETLDG